MVSDEEVLEYYEKTYNNEKGGKNLNINKQLSIDHKILCEKLSRKLKLKETSSRRVRLFMVKDIMENKNLN